MQLKNRTQTHQIPDTQLKTKQYYQYHPSFTIFLPTRTKKERREKVRRNTRLPYPNQKKVVLASEPPNPVVQNPFDILPMLLFQHLIYHLRDAPIVLPIVPFPVSLRDVLPTVSAQFSSNSILSSVVVDDPCLHSRRRSLPVLFGVLLAPYAGLRSGSRVLPWQLSW